MPVIWLGGGCESPSCSSAALYVWMIEENSSGMWDVAVTLLGPEYAWPKCWTERPWFFSHMLSRGTFFTVSSWLSENTSRT